MMLRYLIVLPIAVFLLACNVIKRDSKVYPIPDRPIQFEEAKPPSADPCAICVGFSATKPYNSGSIRWFTCRNSQAKVYLDIRLTKPNFPELRWRLMRDCVISAPAGEITPIGIHYLKCFTEGVEDLISVTTQKFEETEDGRFVKSINFAFLWGNEGKVFEATMSASALSDIYVKDGWQMHYGNGKGCQSQ
ncbi:MAG: hypothetical protein Q7T20_04855 [Saprospiraceae bacterium]|nr:hypothetical protein [Saprospiraceae bacterium]